MKCFVISLERSTSVDLSVKPYATTYSFVSSYNAVTQNHDLLYISVISSFKYSYTSSVFVWINHLEYCNSVFLYVPVL